MRSSRPTFLLSTALLAGCGLETDRTAASFAALPTDTAPPPPALTLTATPAVAGAPFTLTVTGAAPGTTVRFFASRFGWGPSVCPPALGGTCHELTAPATRLGVAIADPNGVATLTTTPPLAIAGSRLALQAMASVLPSPVSNGVTARVYPFGTVVSPADDRDGDGATVGDGDCDDLDATFRPGAPDTVGDREDQDCDGLDGTDGDGDRAASAASGGGDCDDGDAGTFPGATETCDLADENCDGQVDEGFPDGDGSGRPDCQEVALVVTAGWAARNLPLWTCEGQLPLDRELSELTAIIGGMGLGLVRIDEDPTTGVSAAALSPYGAVMVNNGGWADELRSGTVDALLATADKPLIVVGDDLAFMVSRTDTVAGRPELLDLTYVDAFLDNGNLAFKGLGAVLVEPDHPVMTGPWGDVADFAYAGDFDHLTLRPGPATLMTKDTVGSPVVWAVDEGARRVVALQPSAYANNNCPVSDPTGIATIATLYRNALAWTMRLD